MRRDQGGRRRDESDRDCDRNCKYDYDHDHDNDRGYYYYYYYYYYYCYYYYYNDDDDDGHKPDNDAVGRPDGGVGVEGGERGVRRRCRRAQVATNASSKDVDLEQAGEGGDTAAAAGEGACPPTG